MAKGGGCGSTDGEDQKKRGKRRGGILDYIGVQAFHSWLAYEYISLSLWTEKRKRGRPRQLRHGGIE